MTRLPTIKQLQHFSKTAELLHFGDASRELGITQPTLSASIQELELTLGGPVFDRAGKAVRLTSLGDDVLGRARRVLAEVEELTIAARHVAAPLTGALRLGVIPTISAFALPRLLPELRARYPQLKVFLIEDQTAHLIEMQARGDIDVILLALPCSCMGESAVLARDNFVAVFRRDHPLVKEKVILPRQLKGEALLTLQDGHCLRDQTLSACNLKPAADERYAATSLHTLVQMVDNGLGITLLPQLAVKAGLLEGTQLVARPIESANAWRDIALLWRKGAARAEEYQLLANELKRLFRR